MSSRHTSSHHMTAVTCPLADPGGGGGHQGQMPHPQESGEGIQCKYVPRRFFTDAPKSTYRLEKREEINFILFIGR